VTIEDGPRSADAGSALAQDLRDAGLAVPVHIIGVQEGFPLTGAGLDAASVVRRLSGCWPAAIFRDRLPGSQRSGTVGPERETALRSG
jgi:hypothetical protein